MGKFDGILICTDLDHTLLTDDKSISDENKRAVEYFMSEGGLFTFATGRSKPGIEFLFNRITPNAPIILFNGAEIYDIKKDEVLWETFLDDGAKNVLEMVERKYPFAGIEVCAENNIYVSRDNKLVHRQLSFEKLEGKYRDFRDIDEHLRKTLFVGDKDKMPELREGLKNSEFSKRYNFVKSDPCYYELLPPDASKGYAMNRLAQMLGVDKTVGIGDDENDVAMIKEAKIGVAVANAVPMVLDAADFISTDNNSHAISTVIYGIDKGIMEF